MDMDMEHVVCSQPSTTLAVSVLSALGHLSALVLRGAQSLGDRVGTAAAGGEAKV